METGIRSTTTSPDPSPDLGRPTSASSRLRRALRRTLGPLIGRYEMARAALFFGRHPFARTSHLPHFLGIGGQKCGTTWLDRMLRFHPEIGMPRRKEIHFFDGNYWRGLDWYRYQFRGLESRIRGEVTPAYSILPVERIREIYQLNPDLRLVLLLRNPVERAWSHVEMSLLRNRRRTLAQVPEAVILRRLESDAVLRRSRFSAMLRNWLQVFPADRLQLEFMDAIATDPKSLLSRILCHLGADPAAMPWHRMPLGQRVNANPGGGIPPRYRDRLRELLAEEIAELRTMLPRPEVLKWEA